MSRPCEESERLVQYLVDDHPECLEVRSSGGYTPLALACSLHRTSFARILIAGGANQSTRDPDGHNLMHLLLNSIENAICEKAEDIAPLISLLDPQLIPLMLVQRAGDGSMTPLARWLQLCYGKATWDPQDPAFKETCDRMAAMTRLLMSYDESSNQKQLEVLDGSGNAAVHVAVKYGYPTVLEAILDRRPDLLHRENATGCTPLELAVDAWVNQTTRTPRQLPGSRYDRVPEWEPVIDRPSRYFIEGHDRRIRWEMMYQICQDRSQQRPGKRRLVTLFEANEVAKRLTVDNRWSKRSARSRGSGRGSRVSLPDLETEVEEHDEVALWGAVASEYR